MKISLLILALICLPLGISAQSNDVLAQIAGNSITVRDLDAETLKIVERLPLAVAALRKNELEKEINELLFETEAAARKVSREKLLEMEVGKKVANPTDARIQEVYEANRNAFGNATLSEASPRIIAYLRGEQEEQLAQSFAGNLKAKHKVVLVTDVNSANLKPTDTVATVGGKPLLAGKFIERLKAFEYDLRLEAFYAQKNALDNALYSKLIFAEAAKTNVAPEEIIRREISDKFRPPTEADAKKYYDANKAQIPVAFEAAKNEIIGFLAQQERINLQIALRDKLAAKHNVQFLLKEPAAPVLKISVDDDPAKGTANAPVTVVMFTDYECSACRRTHPALTEVLKGFGDKVRFVVRDFPLTDIHPRAFRAAEAANAAHAQGKFFEYIEFLYKGELDDASLKKYAAQTGLDPKRFDADLASGKFAAEIRKDKRDGANYGIKGTPTIYVNGVRINELSPEAIRSAVEKALTKK
ncbi:MAG TPA: thioredoxin domain-containing protein [Pyrinomonadaceae bacterium]|nr:thioredoxin domain-containing protein [Pyrinomonadaceae bacterium]